MTRLISIITIGFLLGCQQAPDYELVTHGNNTYRLDKRSGQISVIEGSKIIPLDEPTTDVAKEAISTLRETKHWPQIDLPQLDSLKLNLRTRWREGYMHFVFTAAPFNRKLREAQQEYLSSKNFKLKLLDSDGFVIVEKQINISDMTRVVDETNKATGMQINSRLPCSAETYLDIQYWSSGWQL